MSKPAEWAMRAATEISDFVGQTMSALMLDQRRASKTGKPPQGVEVDEDLIEGTARIIEEASPVPELIEASERVLSGGWVLSRANAAFMRAALAKTKGA